MKSYTQILPRSAATATLQKTTIFPPNSEGQTATSWNEKPNGSGKKYSSGQANVKVDSSMKLFARYPSAACTLVYLYTDGHSESQKIQDEYVLRNPLKEKPIYNEFKCWIVDGAYKAPAAVYPWYPTEQVKNDVIACMSAEMTCTLEYDSNGGAGQMASQSSFCKKHVDPKTTDVVVEASDVALKACQFTKNSAQFGGWKIDGGVKQPGDLTKLSTDKKAVARWLYQTRYDVTAASNPSYVCVPRVDNGDAVNKKTLVVTQVQSGFEFVKWTDSNGNDVGHLTSQPVVLAAPTWAEVQPVVSQVYTAQFKTDARCTVVSYTNGATSIKNVSGKLTRAVLMSQATGPVATKSSFASVRGVK